MMSAMITQAFGARSACEACNHHGEGNHATSGIMLFTDLITRLLIPARLHSNPSIALTPATANSFRLREAAAAMAAEAIDAGDDGGAAS